MMKIQILQNHDSGVLLQQDDFHKHSHLPFDLDLTY